MFFFSKIVLRNCCFETRQHERILDADKLNTLPFILLPLCGSEEYDMEEFEQFPEEIQLLDDDKVLKKKQKLLSLCIPIQRK